MRIIFSIVLFTTFAIRPVMELSTVLYYQLNIDTIVEKYCVNKERPRLNCNGKCYLMSQMKAKKQPSTENSDTIIITEAFIPLFFQENNFRLKDIFTTFDITHNWKSYHLQPLEISKEIDHPPKTV